jgi:hypothetical protein
LKCLGIGDHAVDLGTDTEVGTGAAVNGRLLRLGESQLSGVART